jgi:hypothetical protein
MVRCVAAISPTASGRRRDLQPRKPRAFSVLAFALEDLLEALVALRNVLAGAFAG